MSTVAPQSAHSSAVTSPTASRLGEWQLTRQLGVGTWCQVYQAAPLECSSSAADYVVKTPRPERSGDRTALQMLRREAALGHRLSHPNLAPVLASQLEQPPYYIVLPYTGGATIEQALEACGRFQTPHALWIIRQIATALQYLHGEGLLHSDVKPANISVAPSGHATLLDLGLSSVQPIKEDEIFFSGTPNYAAPEWFTLATAPSAASDIYSLGLVFYEMLTGRRLEFSEDGCEPTEWSTNPRRVVPSIPGRVVRLLRRMLATEPGDRPTACELAEMLFRLEIDTLDERCAECAPASE